MLPSVAVTAVLLAGAEGLARRFEDPRARARRGQLAWASDTRGGFYTMKSASPGWPPWAEFNRDGLRDVAHAVEKPPRTRRVVCLGDSVTVGPDRWPDAAYPRVLQRKLDARGPGLEVLSVALWGWSTAQERIAYARIARRYRPDAVFLGVCLNDVQELEADLARPSPVLVALHERSALVRRLVGAEGRQIRGVDELFKAPDSARVRAGLERLLAEVRALRAEVRADGAELAVVLFPYRGQVTASAPPPSVQERMAAFCAREGIRFLDALPALRPLGEAAFLEGDGIHLSREGCARVADAVLEQGLLPRAWLSEGPATDVASPVPLLADARGDVRWRAAWALGHARTPVRDAVSSLARALDDPDEGVSVEAARSLGEIGAPAGPARPALLSALDDPHQAVRWSAASALARIGLEPEDVPSLVGALGSRDYYVRAFAVWSLGEMAGHAAPARPLLAAMVDDPDEGVRALVVKSLGKLGPGDPATVAALRAALQRPSWDDRSQAARALGRLGPAAAAALPDLVAALSDTNPYVRREAARALGRIGTADQGARQALARAEGDPDPEVRAAATNALRQLRD
jgi:HEAT repeat protein/lysophospholipase L1-like esterase